MSRLVLGTMNFGPEASEPDSYAIMDRALEHDINFFDTANVYGWRKGEGYTEQIIGRWLAQGGQRRLQTDHIDLFQMHHLDRATPFEEIWQAMEQLVQEGKVIYVGSSNFAGWAIARANEIGRKSRFLGLVSEQSLYNLLSRTVELEVLPACEVYGMGFIPWSPLGGGLLAGALRKAEQGRRSQSRIQEEVEKNRSKLEAYEQLCSKLGEDPAHVALAWLLTNPVVTGPIIGPRTQEQLDGTLRALDIELSEETLNSLDEIFPGPGGPAPEAYAW